MNIEKQIDEKVEVLFDYINHTVVQNYYLSNLQNWDTICASLHIIKELQRPKAEYYLLNSINHLEAIGIMQTVYIEQDAVESLKCGINEIVSNRKPLPKYQEIRAIRNSIFGHPADYGTKNRITRHFFDIEDNQKQVIRHLCWGFDNGMEMNKISICDTVSNNSEFTYSYLIEIESDIINKFKNIMSKFKVQFDSLFTNAPYIFRHLLTKENDEIAINSYKYLEDDIDKVTQGLMERNIYEEFQRKIDSIKFLSDKLKLLFNKQTYKDVEFYTYASTLNKNIEDLQAAIKDIDNPFK